jgi:hypothetical protein
LGIDSAVDEVSGVLLRTAQFDGPTAVEENPAESAKKLSARHMRIRSISNALLKGCIEAGFDRGLLREPRLIEADQ